MNYGKTIFKSLSKTIFCALLATSTFLSAQTIKVFSYAEIDTLVSKGLIEESEGGKAKIELDLARKKHDFHLHSPKGLGYSILGAVPVSVTSVAAFYAFLKSWSRSSPGKDPSGAGMVSFVSFIVFTPVVVLLGTVGGVYLGSYLGERASKSKKDSVYVTINI